MSFTTQHGPPAKSPGLSVRSVADLQDCISEASASPCPEREVPYKGPHEGPYESAYEGTYEETCEGQPYEVPYKAKLYEKLYERPYEEPYYHSNDSEAHTHHPEQNFVSYTSNPGHGQVEIHREAQHIGPLEIERSMHQEEEVELDDSGDVLESLPTPRAESPSSSSRVAVRKPTSMISRSNRNSYYDFSEMPPIDMRVADGSAESALPRMKTIEQYLKSARKTNDLQLEFQLAQYMMQTALSSGRGTGSTSNNGAGDSRTESTNSNGSDTDNSGTSYLFKESMNSLKRLSERGYAEAQYLLGDIYSSPAVRKPDLEKSFRYFLMAAKHGHAEASYRAALCLQEGWGTQRDARRALQFYKAAAVRNQPGALYQLGMAYFYGGMGLPDTSANRQAGVKWLSRAANVSDSTYNKAPHALARIFEVGFKDLVIPDGAYAARLYARSAELGYIPAAARLGRAYELGELGCPQDASLSIHYFTIAALGNDPVAQLAMCAWYMVGAGPDFPVNRDEAYEWALRAALNGLPKAQYTLGFFLENGIGTHRDVIKASTWYHKAAENGFEKAREKLGNNNNKKGRCILM